MASSRARAVHPDDEERCERIAELLARGVVRHMLGRRRESEESGDNRLEVSGETRLHVHAVNGQRTPGTAGDEA